MNTVLKLSRFTNSAVILGFTGAYIYVKAIYHENCKKMLEARKNDPSVLLPPSVKKLFNEVMDEMKLKEEEKSQIKLFISETSDFQRHGKIYQKKGALLGVPQYFLIDRNEDIKVSKLVEDKLVDVNESHVLADSLHLSQEAKKFAFARELYELLISNNQMLLGVPFTLSMTFIFCSYLYEKVQKKLNRKPRYLLHVALLLSAAASYALAFDFIIFYREANADFMACDLGKSYITGGIEYYTKMIKKNKNLKKIDKNAPYSNDGDVNYTVLGKHHIPLQKRLIYLRDIYNSKKKKPSVWNYIMFAH